MISNTRTSPFTELEAYVYLSGIATEFIRCSPCHKLVLTQINQGNRMPAKSSLIDCLNQDQLEELEKDGFRKFFLDPLMGYRLIFEVAPKTVPEPSYYITQLGRVVLERISFGVLN